MGELALASIVMFGALTCADANAPGSNAATPGSNAATPGSSAATPASNEDPPLVAYTLQLPPETVHDPGGPSRRLKSALYEMDHHPPPQGEACSHTLGAPRFADQYSQLASARQEMGESDAAMEALVAALACTPRDVSVHAAIAELHLTQGHIPEARAAAARGAAIDPNDTDIHGLLGRVDFLEERWADANAHFHTVITGDVPDRLRPYYELFSWLSQRRAGDRTPKLPPREKHADDEEEQSDEENTSWPAPILAALKGEKKEAQLVERLSDMQSETLRRQRLTEALYYLGEQRLAEGNAEIARRYFAGVIVLKLTDYVEFGMARAELAKIRERAANDAGQSPGRGATHRVGLARPPTVPDLRPGRG